MFRHLLRHLQGEHPWHAQNCCQILRLHQFATSVQLLKQRREPTCKKQHHNRARGNREVFVPSGPYKS